MAKKNQTFEKRKRKIRNIIIEKNKSGSSVIKNTRSLTKRQSIFSLIEIKEVLKLFQNKSTFNFFLSFNLFKNSVNLKEIFLTNLVFIIHLKGLVIIRSIIK